MRILTLSLSLTLLLTLPCFAQDTNKKAVEERRYDISPLLEFDQSPAVSLEAFLLAKSSNVSKELRVFDRLRYQSISCVFDKTPFSDVIAFYQDITGLNFHSSIDPTVLVNLRLRKIALGQVLLRLLDQVDADASLHGSVIYIHKKRQLPLCITSKAQSAKQKLSNESFFLETLSKQIKWSTRRGHSLEIHKTTLIASQSAVIQKALKKTISTMIAAKAKKEKTANFHQLSYLPQSPSRKKIDQSKRLLRSQTLSLVVFDGERFENALKYFTDLSKIPVRVDSACQSVLNKTLSLYLRKVPLQDFLDVLATEAKLSYSITPTGIEFYKIGQESQFHFKQRRALRAYLKHKDSDRDQRKIQLSAYEGKSLWRLQSIAKVLGLGFSCENKPIEDLLEAPCKEEARKAKATLHIADLLKAHKLHYNIVYGHLAITQKAVKALPRPQGIIFSKSALRGLNMGEFATQLSICSKQPYILPAGIDNVTLLSIPAGSTIEQAISLAKRQSGLEVKWLAGTKTGAWSLSSPDEGLFQQSERAFRFGQSSAIPAVQTMIQARRKTLVKSLNSLEQSTDMNAFLDAVQAALSDLTDVNLFAEAANQDYKSSFLRISKRQSEIDKRIKQRLIDLKKNKMSTHDAAKTKARIAKYEKEMTALKKEMTKLRKASLAPNLPRARKHEFQDRELQVARKLDQIKRRSNDLGDTMRKKLHRFTRMKKLVNARIQSDLNTLRISSEDTRAQLAVLELVKKSIESLKSQSWSAVFPNGWGARRSKTVAQAKLTK